jgi:outer membrane protein assembly factor BamB
MSSDNVYALNATTGALVWKYPAGGISSPAVASGIVYVGSGDHNVYALNATTGALVWKYTTGGIVDSSPAVVGGVVFVGSEDAKVYALNASTGALKWSTTGAEVLSSPAVAGGLVYVSMYNNCKVYALNATTGLSVWNYATGSVVTSSPAVAGGLVYVGSFDDKVYALNASTGALKWNYKTGSYVSSSPAVAGGVVFVGSDDDKVYALNAPTGALVWNYATGSVVTSSPAVADGKVYVGSEDGNVYCLNASSGAKKWNYKTGGYVDSSPAVADGKVYVGSCDAKVYAFGPYSVSFSESGLPQGAQWSVTFNGQTQSSTSSSITFSAVNGVYLFSITPPSGYSASPSSGSITVNGANVGEQITFGPMVHDVAVTNVTSSKAFGFQGCSMNINVTAANPGAYTETFNVTAYANTTIVGALSTNITLTSGASATITFRWNTTGFPCGKYAISAYATPVPGETNLGNNNFTDGWVEVRLWGDVTGDGKVFGDDVIKLILIYSEVYPYTCPPYNVNNMATYYYNTNPATGKVEHLMPDINGNGRVDFSDVAKIVLIYSGWL